MPNPVDLLDDFSQADFISSHQQKQRGAFLRSEYAALAN